MKLKCILKAEADKWGNWPNFKLLSQPVAYLCVTAKPKSLRTVWGDPWESSGGEQKDGLGKHHSQVCLPV